MSTAVKPLQRPLLRITSQISTLQLFRKPLPPNHHIPAMNNFGVIEVASTKTKNAPGWAYVPDNGPNPAQAFQPTSRKNRAARNQAGALGLSDLSARQDARLRKELDALDKEPSTRDVPIPPRPGGRASHATATAKHTPNVRRILQSQKTFANHLDDYVAFRAAAENNPQAGAPPWFPPAPAASAAAAAAASHRRSGPTAKAAPPRRPISTSSAAAPETDATAGPGPDTSDVGTQQRDGTVLPPYGRPPPPSHPGDADPLLVSRTVPFPTDAELRSLMTAPPLGYLEARAVVDDDDAASAPRYPERRFCEVCGYWGRVKCGKCGGRVCALDCLETHREECLRRYGL